MDKQLETAARLTKMMPNPRATGPPKPMARNIVSTPAPFVSTGPPSPDDELLYDPDTDDPGAGYKLPGDAVVPSENLPSTATPAPVPETTDAPEEQPSSPAPRTVIDLAYAAPTPVEAPKGGGGWKMWVMAIAVLIIACLIGFMVFGRGGGGGGGGDMGGSSLGYGGGGLAPGLGGGMGGGGGGMPPGMGGGLY